MMMDGTRVTDFSIDRILSAQFGRGPEPEPDPQSASFRPVPVPVPGCLLYRGMRFGDAVCPCALYHAEIGWSNQNHGVYFSLSPADVQQLGGHRGQQQSHQKARMRTVFTAGQSEQLEALFQITDYPTLEARAEVARSTGLGEETVRVWFKNRRARRKRHHSSSKVKSPGPTPSAAAEKMLSR